MPKLSPTMDEGAIAKWHKKEGEFVKANELLLEIATDKATIEYNALDEGWLRKILTPEKGVAKINQPIAIFAATQDESIAELLEKAKPKPEEKVTEEVKFMKEEKVAVAFAPLQQPAFIPEPPFEKVSFVLPEPHPKATPYAKELAKEKGVDLSTVAGTGPGGRIISEDVEKAQPQGVATFGRREIPEIPAGTYEEIPLSPMRRIIARRLQESKSFIPHFYVKQTIDAEPLVVLREQLKQFDLPVTYNDILIRGAALALRQHPEVNRGFNSVNQTMIQFKTIDISVAVSVEEGLITPIIRYADFKNLGQISVEARHLIDKARRHKLEEHEYKGGSFSVSNLGMYGIAEFSAVLNPPQAAILAIGGIEEVPVVKDNEIVIGKKLALVLSADHRVIDGALAATFLKTLKKILENPSVVLL